MEGDSVYRLNWPDGKGYRPQAKPQPNMVLQLVYRSPRWPEL
jgi:hypothetical protein